MKEEGKLLGVKKREMEGVARKANVKLKSEPYLIIYMYENIKIKFIIRMLIFFKRADEERAPWAHTSLAEDLSLISSAHLRWLITTSKSSSRESNILLLPQAPALGCAGSPHRNTCMNTIEINLNIKNKTL